jgi:hypothetical protein
MSTENNGDNNNNDSPTYDSKLTDLYSPAPAQDLSHLASINPEYHPQGVVTDKDYDRMVAAAAAAQRGTPTAPVAVAAPSSPLDISSARTGTGQRVTDPALLTPDTIITHGGIETTLGTLLAIGQVMRDANGNYRSVAPGSEQAPQQPQQDREPTDNDTLPPNEPLDEQSEAVLTEALTKAPAQCVGAAASFINANGAVSDEAISQLAIATGQEPEAVREKFAQVTAAYSREAVKLGAKGALCSEEVSREALEWARHAKASELKETANRHFAEGRANYTGFVIDYLATLDQRDPNRILTATPVKGRSVHWDKGNNCVVVTLADGTEMSWSAAVRAKLISM